MTDTTPAPATAGRPGWLDRLSTCGENLPDGLRAEVLADGPGAVPALLRVIEDDLEAEGAENWSAMHAAELLGDLGDARAVPVLIRCLRECDGLDMLRDRACAALGKMGPQALEPCLEAHDRGDGDLRDDLACALGQLQVRDPRIVEVLTYTLVRNPGLGASACAHYGDPQLLAALGQAFDRFELQEEPGLFAHHELIELREAIRELGGGLTPEQDEKFRRSEALRLEEMEDFEAFFSDTDGVEGTEPYVREAPKPGRNQPCWCGSGRKYKHCHLDQDQGRV